MPGDVRRDEKDEGAAVARGVQLAVLAEALLPLGHLRLRLRFADLVQWAAEGVLSTLNPQLSTGRRQLGYGRSDLDGQRKCATFK